MKQLHFYSKVFLPLFLIITACSKSDLSEHGAKAHSCGFLGKVVKIEATRDKVIVTSSTFSEATDTTQVERFYWNYTDPAHLTWLHMATTAKLTSTLVRFGYDRTSVLTPVQNLTKSTRSYPTSYMSLEQDCTSQEAESKQVQQLINIQQYSPAGLTLQVSKQPDTEDTEEKSFELFFEEFVDFVNQADEEEALEDINLAESCGVGINQSLQSFLERTYKLSGKEYTPLHYSAEEGKLNFVKLLVETHGICPDYPTQEEDITPLQCAVSRGHYKVAEYLAARGADLRHRDVYKNSVLNYAVQSEHTILVRWLIQRGLEPTNLDNDENNVLHVAVQMGLRHFLALLLKHLKELEEVLPASGKLDHMLNVKNKKGLTPLDIAKNQQLQDICAMLTEKVGKKRTYLPECSNNASYAKKAKPS
ncbi:MAG: ankyrin repeat domain-containing protein [Bacteroidota bacterium]